MPSGGSTCASPGGAATAHRRRVVDLIPDTEKTQTPTDQGVASSDDDDDDDDESDNGSKNSIAVAFVFLDDMTIRIFKLMKSRKNIFGVLILMVVVSMFLKFSLVLSNARCYNSEINTGAARRLNNFFILNTLPKPSHQTQLIMMAAQHDDQQHLSSMPKRVLEKYPVRFFNFFFG